MELGVSHVQNLSSLTPIVDNIFDKCNKNLVPIRSLPDHDIIYVQKILLEMTVVTAVTAVTAVQLILRNSNKTIAYLSELDRVNTDAKDHTLNAY